MKKEYIILAALIVCLSAYLWFHKENRDNYKLPDILKIDTSQVTSILIEKKDGPIKLTRKEKTWTLTDKNFPADTSLVATMLDTIKTFKLTALVSQQNDLNRYELDQENKIHVTISFGEKDKFEFTAGKDAPSFNHTFVMLAKDNNVYHAMGSFRNDFNQNINDYRDKTVLEVKDATVKQFSVSKGKTSKTLISKETKSDKEKTIKTWQSKDGRSADKEKITSFLSSISYLKCDAYVEDKMKKDFKTASPSHSIQIDTDKKIVFNLYKLDGQDQTYGISSMNDYVFVLNDYDSKKIASSIDSFLGIKPKEK
ncbi:MAG: DUF4340 domain-containing protein [Pseudomonadota bacterium]